MKQIKLTQNKFALVDNEDYEALKIFAWSYHVKGYAQANRMILNAPEGLQVDHINGNGLDNRRCNLRLVTNAQNAMNRNKYEKNLSSKYKGVSWEKSRKKWRADIQLDVVRTWLGYFDNERHAALAYDLWAKDIYKEYSKTNFTVVA